VASLALNAWLLAGERPAPEPECPQVPPPEPAQQVSFDRVAVAFEEGKCPEEERACTTEVAACQKVVQGCSDELRELQRLDVRFLTEDPNPELDQKAEAILGPYLDQMPDAQWEIECRGNICRVDQFYSVKDGYQEQLDKSTEIRLAMRAGGVYKVFTRILYGGGTWARDAVTGERLSQEVAHYLYDPREEEAE